ncbi:MAG: Arginyl-tRNA synthetase [uncultured Truepera sp.]|uniref:Arginine--tRNA ligase n=1 Tax=uncultured Truepera sp. TaxID=543023 RepID=A0A6J4VA24_9DEIN|nr:MAG: Arginyl-tRNA synthetase [uncultured Truepera sp.]
MDVKGRLKEALEEAVRALGTEAEVSVQAVPEGKAGDYGSPVAFGLAKKLRQNPVAIAKGLLERLELPPGIARAEAVGPYLNFHLDPGPFVEGLVTAPAARPERGEKAIVEHTSVNPNKEAHVGHLRNIVLGDACARILKAAGYAVEVQNYIDDTGRQAAESIFAVSYFGETYDGSEKYDHWLGKLYVRLGQAKETDAETIERGVSETMHRLERGELRGEIEKVLRAQLTTYYALGAEYDLLVWESDIVRSGFLAQALNVLRGSDDVFEATEGKYAGALVMDVSKFLPGLEEPLVVLVRSDGNAMYVAKDIGTQFWKVGLFEGLKFTTFDTQPSGKTLYTSAPEGDPHPDGLTFAHADEIINVIDARQSHPQTIVRTALALTDTAQGFDSSHHLAYEVVTLEGQAMSGRKGVTLAIDTVVDEAKKRARAVVAEKNSDLPSIDTVARQVGVGALRFAMLKSEARRVIDFRWEQALSLQGDSAPYVQYAHARACSILRAAQNAGVGEAGADWSRMGGLEVKLAQELARLPEVVDIAAREFAPHLVAQYCLDVATAWNGFYNHRDASGKPDTQVLKAEPGLREARVALVRRVRETLAAALALLGIEAPEEM